MSTVVSLQLLQRPQSARSTWCVRDLPFRHLSTHKLHAVRDSAQLRCQPRPTLRCSAASSGDRKPATKGGPGLVRDSSNTVLSRRASDTGTGVFLLLLINLAVFAADSFLKLPIMSKLYLHHNAPKWWQFVTAAFCHHSWDHLSSNLFMLMSFGRIVEEEEGSFGVWLTYLVTSIGASVASFVVEPRNTISMGASGAVFGLFAVAVLLKLRFNFRKLVECLVLGQFVVKQVLQEVVSAQSGGAMIGGTKVGHVAHLGGALIGVLLVLLLSRLPEVEPTAKKPAAK